MFRQGRYVARRVRGASVIYLLIFMLVRLILLLWRGRSRRDARGRVASAPSLSGRCKVSVMFKMLVDTCVWLDVVKDPRQVPVVGVVEEMIKQKLIELIVPRIVLDEFRQNRGRIANESAKSLSTHFRLVKDAVGKIGGDPTVRSNSFLPPCCPIVRREVESVFAPSQRSRFP